MSKSKKDEVYMPNIEVYTTEFILGTDIVPRKWDKWFWSLISENAPFSWEIITAQW